MSGRPVRVSADGKPSRGRTRRRSVDPPDCLPEERGGRWSVVFCRCAVALACFARYRRRLSPSGGSDASKMYQQQVFETRVSRGSFRRTGVCRAMLTTDPPWHRPGPGDARGAPRCPARFTRGECAWSTRRFPRAVATPTTGGSRPGAVEGGPGGRVPVVFAEPLSRPAASALLPQTYARKPCEYLSAYGITPERSPRRRLAETDHTDHRQGAKGVCNPKPPVPRRRRADISRAHRRARRLTRSA